MLPQRKIIPLFEKKLEMEDGTFHGIFEDYFCQGENVMIEYEQGKKIYKLTFDQVKKMVFSVAYALKERLQNQKDLYIALNMENSFQWVVGFWAILASGNKPYLVNSRHPLSLTSSIVETLEIHYSLDNFKPCSFKAESIDINPLLETVVPEDVSFEWANEIALSTSGTTLKEKICLYSGEEIRQQLKNTFPILKQSRMVRATYEGTIKVLAFLPFYHIFGLITVFFWFVFFGYEMVLLKDYSPDTILHTIRRCKVTHLFAVPLFWHSIEENVNREIAKRDEKTQKKFKKGLAIANSLPSCLSFFFSKRAFKEVRQSLFGDSIRFCISGGSFLRPSAQYMMNGIGYSLYNGYGTSEIGITSCELENSNRKRNLGSIGKPFASVEYQIVDGCLCVKGKSTCHEIIVDKKREKVGSYFETLDLVEKGKDGRYYIKGRKSDLIIGESGENINPDDLESRFDFSSYPVLSSSILGLGEEKEVVTFVIQLPASVLREEVEKIKEYVLSINSSLPSASNIKSLVFTFSPLQAEGAIKVSRAYLRRGIQEGKIRLLTFEELFESKQVLSSSDLAQILKDIFSEVLHIEKEMISEDSQFELDLGGNSLDYYNLLAQINSRFNCNIEYNPDAPLLTVRDFENYLKERKQ